MEAKIVFARRHFYVLKNKCLARKNRVILYNRYLIISTNLLTAYFLQGINFNQKNGSSINKMRRSVRILTSCVVMYPFINISIGNIDWK